VGRLQDKVVLVTGSASGIGAACVERFASEGATVVGCDVNAPNDERGAPATELAAFAQLDVRDETAIRELIATIVHRYGRIDSLLNSAGTAGGGPVHMVDVSEWDRVLSINLTGTFLPCKHTIAAMLDQEPIDGERGSIVNIASVEGLEGTAGGSAYNASKGAVAIFTKNMALDYGPRGIRVNAICPGFIDTPMLRGVFGEGMEAVRADIIHEHALRRLGRASEIAAAAQFLLSSDASFVSGVALPVDGGYTAGRDHQITELMGLS
jgi:NAD(P)-dependent dehydrogenase (short-subunit alcohol dehydrogenase family)